MTNRNKKNRVLYRKPIGISTEQWLELMQDSSIFKSDDIKLITTLYHYNNSRAKASVLAKMLGVNSHRSLNLQIWRLGERIIKRYPKIKYPVNKGGTVQYWHIPFWAEDAEIKGQYYWQLRPELKEAVRIYLSNDGRVSMDSQESILITQELPHDEVTTLFEGAKKQITVNVYERNVRARRFCIDKYGYKCCVCNFNFEKFYGEIGKEFIEVHHLKPLNEISEAYQVDPINDLRPICPNCHAMVHRTNLSIEELKAIVEDRKNVR